MLFRKQRIATALTSLLIFPLCALDLNPSVILEAKTAVAIPTDADEEYDNRWDLLQGDCSAEFKLDASHAAHSAFMDIALLYDAMGAGSSGIALDKDDEEHNIFFKFKEGWYDYNGGFWSVRVGRQITAWGAADGLQVTDVLCPKDQTRLFTSDYSDSRIGIDAVRLSYNGTILSADAYWIPIFTPGTLPLERNNPLRKLMIRDRIPTITAGRIFYIPLEFSWDDIELPKTQLKNGEYAGKVSAYLPFADFSLYGFWGWDDEPIISYNVTGLNAYGVPTGVLLSGYRSPESTDDSGSFRKMAMIGADASIPMGPLVFRAEGAFFPGRSFSTSMQEQLIGKESYIVLNEITFLAGLDLNTGTWSITGQYYGDSISGARRSATGREGYFHQATLSISKTFIGGALEIGVSGIMEFNDFSFVIQPSISYDATDQLTFSLGANFFRPSIEDWAKDRDRFEKKVGKYGYYEDLSCVTLGAKFSF